jgi:hypothetical protein
LGAARTVVLSATNIAGWLPLCEYLASACERRAKAALFPGFLYIKSWAKLFFANLSATRRAALQREATTTNWPGKGPEMRRHKKSLDKGKEARRRARRTGLAPAATRVIKDKRKKPSKHKRNLLTEEE